MKTLMLSLLDRTAAFRVKARNIEGVQAARRRCGALTAVALLAFVAGGAFARGQAQVDPGLRPPAATQAAPPPSGPSRITLDVVARDHKGAGVAGLTQGDFVVLDSGQAKPIESFRAVTTPGAPNEPPVQVILLIDSVNTNFTTVAFVRDQISRFLRKNGGELTQPTSLVLLADTSVRTLVDSTLDGKQLSQALSQSEIELRTVRRSAGFYGAVERFQISIGALQQVVTAQKGRPGRKLLVWLSPGWPLLSGPRVDLSAKDQNGIFQTIVTMSNTLRDAHMTLYSVDPLGTADAGTLRTSYYKQFLKGATAPNRVDIGDLGLQVLAVQSGGRALSSNNDVDALIEQCYADARAFYELTFVAAPAERANEYRPLEVRSERPGLTMQTRTGYYAEP